MPIDPTASLGALSPLWGICGVHKSALGTVVIFVACQRMHARILFRSKMPYHRESPLLGQHEERGLLVIRCQEESIQRKLRPKRQV